MQITDVAQEIFTELGEPDDISPVAVTYWLKSNLGFFSNLIETDIVIENDDFAPQLLSPQKDILKTLYFIYYYQRQVNKNLGAAAFTSIAEIKEGDITVRRVNKTEVAKSYTALIRAAKDALDFQLTVYRQRGQSNVEQICLLNPITSEDGYNNNNFGPRSILEFTRAI